MKVVKVKFRASDYNNSVTAYNFFMEDGMADIGDPVVCDTAKGLAVGTILEILDSNPSGRTRASKWIIQKVDLATHMQRLQREEHAKKIRAELAKKKFEFEAQQLYSMMAVSDPEVAKMLEELKKLEG